MSLILEALRKSEAERHRGLPPRLDSPMLRPTRRRQRLAPGLALLVLGAPAAGWFVYRGMAPDFADGNTDTSLAALLPALPEAELASAAGPGQMADAAPAGATNPVAGGQPGGQSPRAAASIAAPGSVALGNNAAALGGGSFSAAQDLPPPERMRPHTPSTRQAPAQSAQPVAAAAPSAPVSVAQPPPETPSTSSPALAAPPAAVPAPVPVPVTPPPPAPVEVASIAPVPVTPPEPVVTVPLIYDLSYEIRRELPELVMSMHVYSSERTSRFIVLNGKRLQEGTTAAESELELIEIQRGGAVMAFRGTRFLLPRQGM